MISLTLKLVDPIPVINGKILNAFRLRLTSVLKRAAPAIQRRIGDVCEQLIERTPEYQSLLNSTLLGELGVPDVANRLDGILNTIKTSCDVQLTPLTQAGQTLSGGLTIGMIKSDFMDILGLSEASYTTEKGLDIPWLDWLIRQGDRIIVVGYDVKIPLSSPRDKHASRTGLALMEPGTGWRVPPAFSGTITNNFITRAFNPSQIEILLLKIIQEEVMSRL